MDESVSREQPTDSRRSSGPGSLSAPALLHRLGKAGWGSSTHPTPRHHAAGEQNRNHRESDAATRAVHELKEIAILTVYLYVTLGAVILMKVAVLHDAGISFVPWGIAAVKALVLAKFMLLGLLHRQSVNASLGELTGGKLYKTLAGILILLLVLIPYFAFHVLDEALGEREVGADVFVERGWAGSSSLFHGRPSLLEPDLAAE